MESPTLAAPVGAIAACRTTAWVCSTVTAPLAETIFPIGAVSRLPTAGCAVCARAESGSTATADRKKLAVKTTKRLERIVTLQDGRPEHLDPESFGRM